MFSLGGDVKPLALSPSSIHFSWKGRWNNPLKLFKKSRWRRPRCLGLSDMCFHWSGWARWDQHGLKHWSGCIVQFAFTCWRPISPLLFLSNSAIDCKWGKLAPAVITGILRIWMRDTVDDGLWLNSKDESKKKKLPLNLSTTATLATDSSIYGLSAKKCGHCWEVAVSGG